MELHKILVCGFGNKLKRDDGLGPCTIEKLQKEKLPDYIILRDFGISGFRAAIEMADYNSIIAVDAIKAGEKPGTVYRFVINPLDLNNYKPITSFTLSLHENDLQRIMAMANLIGRYPQRLIILGCEPLDISLGLTLSNIVTSAIDKLVELVLGEIKNIVGIFENGY